MYRSISLPVVGALMLLLLFVSSSSCVDIPMKLLVLAAKNDGSSTNAIYQALESRGIPRTVITIPTSGSLNLWDNQGNPNYMGIVIADDRGNARFTAQQEAEIEEYTSSFGVPQVVLQTTPSDETGTAMSAGQNAGTSNFQVRFTNEGQSRYGGPGVAKNKAIQINGGWRAPVAITDASTTTGVLQIENSGTVLGFGAVVHTYNKGTTRQHKKMCFYFDIGFWDVIANLYSHVWVPFVTHNVYFGQRRAYFSAQIDDFFLASFIWDAAADVLNYNSAVRVTPSDMDELVQWQNELNAKLPSGSDVRLELYFNGAGGNGAPAPNVPNDNGALLTWSKANLEHFWWGSHTWDHTNMNEMDRATTIMEITNNNNFAEENLNSDRLFLDSMVTPEISGLQNNVNLQALMDSGVYSACGDSSVPQITNPYPYHGKWTDWFTATNGQKFFIVPRAPTNIFYNTHLPELDVDEYNWMTRRNIGFDQMVAEEAASILDALARLNWKEYMFHQANLIFYTRNGLRRCLVCEWVDAVTDLWNQYFDLPLITAGQHRLAAEFIAREARDNCFGGSQISGSIRVTDDRRTISSISVNNQCNTRAYVTVPINSVKNFGASETYANFDRTLYFENGLTTVVLSNLEYSDGLPVPTTTPPPTTTTQQPTTTTPQNSNNGNGGGQGGGAAGGKQTTSPVATQQMTTPVPQPPTTTLTMTNPAMTSTSPSATTTKPHSTTAAPTTSSSHVVTTQPHHTSDTSQQRPHMMMLVAVAVLVTISVAASLF